MMALNCPIPVVSPGFYFPHPHDLDITRKVWKIGRGSFGVNDANGNLVFKVKESLFTFREKRVILDAAGLPIVTLREKVRLISLLHFYVTIYVLFIVNVYLLLCRSCDA